MEIPYSLLSVDKLIDLATNLEKTLNEQLSQYPLLEQFVLKMKTSKEKAKKIFLDKQDDVYTAKILSADQQRDQAYKALRNYLKAGADRLNLEYSRAAEKVYAIFIKNNLQLYRFDDVEQSQALQLLFQDLESVKEELELIHAVGWVEELEEAQRNFETIFTENASSEINLIKEVLVFDIQQVIHTLQEVYEAKEEENVKSAFDQVQRILEKISMSITR